MKVVFGPNAYALTDWMTTLPDDEPMIRVYGHNEPEPKDNCIDTSMFTIPETLEDLGKGPHRLDVICAAVVSQSALMVNDRTFTSQVSTNVASYVTLVQAVLPCMVRAKYGRFVYLSSFRSVTPVKGAVLYGACKAFGEALFAGINEEYGSRNIKAWSLRLGYLDGGLVGPRPEGVRELTPKQITHEINYCLAGDYDGFPTINLGDHRG